MRLYILTAVHNYLEDTKKLLKSISSQTFRNFDIFLVDDGSSDGTNAFIHKNYPSVNIIKGDGNLWWSASLNLGLRKILKKAGKDDLVWIINNDCYFHKYVLQNLLSYQKRIGYENNITGSVIMDSKTKKISDDGVSIDWKQMNFKSGGTDALSTKGTLYPIQIFRKIGLFDAKHFPHYFSDYEFSIRAKRFGFGLNVCRKSHIYNRADRTGIERVSQKLRPSEIINLILSKRSKVNLLLQINMIRYACPNEFRLGCYYLLFAKFIKAIRLFV